MNFIVIVEKFIIYIRYIYFVMSVYNLQTLINLRRIIHQNPEIGFKQFQTQAKIINVLISIGVPQQSIQKIASTGLLVNLNGKGKKNGRQRTIAYRTDLDALSVQENNLDLQYRSRNPGVAHLCGHDGHIVWIVGFAMKFIDHAEEIPQDITFRLIFQPSQQGPVSGAKKMIEEGCLIGVDQIYGAHNFPVSTPQRIWIKEGPILSEASFLILKIVGTSGHTSEPSKVKDALKQGVRFYTQYNQYIESLDKQGLKFGAVLPVLRCGQRFNVYSEQCTIQGTVRSFEPGLADKIHEKVLSIIKTIEEKGLKTKLQFETIFSMVVNHPKQTQNIKRCLIDFLGKQMVGQGLFPHKGSQDFSEYLKVIPGAFFGISTSDVANQPFVHNCNYNFNDNFIDLGAQVWWKLALDRAFHD